MLVFTCLLASSLQSVALGASAASPRDPRTQPLMREDALWSARGVIGRVLCVSDLDGDGVRDLVAHVLGDSPVRQRLDALSSKDGKRIRTLMEPREGELDFFPVGGDGDWDAGGDVDGDGVADVLVGLSAAKSAGVITGVVRVHSGKDGRVLAETAGECASATYGQAVAFVGDVDGDGRADYACGSTRIEARWIVLGRITVRSGRDASILWTRTGDTPVWHTGGVLCGAPDLDGDGVPDLIAEERNGSKAPAELLSGRDGRLIARVDALGGPVLPLGDIDGDGEVDLGLDRIEQGDHVGGIRLLGGRKLADLGEARFPDAFDPYAVAVAFGDIDGDGCADFALGGPNFHLRGPGDPGWSARDDVPIDLRSKSLADALALESNPWCAMTWESGGAFVYSGRDRIVIAAVYGRPGSRDGMGRALCALPDISGDGAPDFVVVDSTGAHAFAGPGPTKRK